MLWTLVLMLWAWKGLSAPFGLSWAGVVGLGVARAELWV